jgi:hypothetical protein
MIYFILFTFCLLIGNATKIVTRILKTPITGISKNPQLHHVVLISNTHDLYTIDFSPMRSQIISPEKTAIDLFLARYVPGEIRVREIQNCTFEEDRKIIDLWNKSNNVTTLVSLHQTISAIQTMNDTFLREKMMYIIQHWDTSMQLYTNNCQHFSRYAKNYLERS